jgi:hypothetical protein
MSDWVIKKHDYTAIFEDSVIGIACQIIATESETKQDVLVSEQDDGIRHMVDFC